MTTDVEERDIEEPACVPRRARPSRPSPTDLPFLGGISILTLIVLCFVAIMVISPRVHRRVGLKAINLAQLSQPSQKKLSIDFVFAQSHESLERLNETITELYNIESLSQYAKRVFVYSKSDAEGAVVQVHSAVPLAHTVEKLPNIGREGHAYLTHITTHYSDLASVNVFLQANVEFLDAVVARLTKLIHEKTGMMNLGAWISCRCDGLDCNTIPGLLLNLRDVYHVVSGKMCEDDEVFHGFNRGQFAVSHHRITARPVEFYEMLLSRFTTNTTASVYTNSRYLGDSYKGMYLTPNNPLWVHVLERSWALVFDCYKTRLECDCALQGTCPFFPTHCQCVDS